MNTIIIDTKDRYYVSDDGNVINIKTNKVLKGDVNSKGYLRVCLLGKRQFIHRLVAIHYLPNPDNLPQVNHEDGNKLNNHYLNLKWCTNIYNQQHAIANGLIILPFIKGSNHMNAKLKEEDILVIRELYKTQSVISIATLYNVKPITIYSITSRRNWSHI